MKLYYNTVSNDLVTIDASGETWTQGDVDSKTLEVYFGTVAGEVFTVNTGLVLTHECRVVVERPDGAVSPELFLTPQLDGSYKLVISGWISGVEGNVKITPRLKLGDVVTAYGLAIIPVAEGILPADSVITPEEYNLLLVAINDLAGRVTIAEADIIALETFQSAMIAGTQAVRKLKWDTANPASTFTVEGETRWSVVYKTIETRLSASNVLRHGLDVLAFVRNRSGSTLNAGEVVYVEDEAIAGASQPVVKRATNATDTAYAVLGVVSETSIANNSTGFITLIGEVTLSGFTAGQGLYLGVNGAITTTLPTAPARIVKLGTALSTTRVFIYPHIIPSLQMLSDTNINVAGMTKPVLTKVDNHWVAYDIAPYEANLAQALIDIGVAEGDIDSLEGRLDTAESTLTTKADKSTTIVGLNLSANITKSQLLEAVGNATTLAAGFMSATDKSYLGELYALLDTDDADALVNTLGEILQLFENYPEGADIVTALAGKADVVHTHVEADITDLDKYSQAEADALLLTKVDKVTGKSLIDDTEITRLSGMETGAEVNVIEVVQVGGSPLTVTNKTVNIDLSDKVDKDLSNDTLYPLDTLTGTERLYVDDNGVAKKTTVTGIATFVNAAAGAFVASGDYKPDGLGAYKSAMLTYHDVTLVTNGDFKCNIKSTQDTKQIFYVLFPTVTATNTLRLSTNDGTTFANVLKNGATLRANIVSGQMVKMQWNGTNFIADIQGDVEIVERYTSKINSTFGQFNPHDNGVPLVKEVLGRTIPSLTNLVTNGDFATNITGWSSLTGGTTGIFDSGTLKIEVSNQAKSAFQEINATTGNIIYVTGLIKKNSGTNPLLYILPKSATSGAITTIMTDTQFNAQTNGTTVKYSGSFAVTNSGYRIVVGREAPTTYSLNADNIMSFDLTASHGVTATSGTAYDNAVADIEAMLALNDGYISSTSTTHVVNSQFKSVGKNLVDDVNNRTEGFIATSNGIVLLYPSQTAARNLITPNLISIKPSTQYVISTLSSQRIREVFYYDVNGNYLNASAINSTAILVITTSSNVHYLRFRIDSATTVDVTAFYQLEQGTVATTYAPYNSETQKFNHGALRSTIDKTVRDKIRYLNGQYVLDVYINSADNTALATPLLATQVIDVDGTLIQESVTTLEQLQDIPTTYDIEFSMNTEQSVKTLVQRDKIQQQEIDSNEARLDVVEPKVTALETLTDNIVDGSQDIDYDNTISELTAVTVKTAIDELASGVSDNAGNISSLETNAEMKSNKVISWSATPTDTAYPSEKLVYDSTIMGVKKNGTLLTPNETRQVDVTTFKVSSQLASLSNNGTINKSSLTSYDYVLLVIMSTSQHKQYSLIYPVANFNYTAGVCSLGPAYTTQGACEGASGTWIPEKFEGVTTAIQNATDYATTASSPLWGHLVQTSSTLVRAYLPSGYSLRVFGITL